MVYTVSQEDMPPAPQGWAAKAEFNHHSNHVDWFWISPDCRAAIGPHLGGFELFRFRNRVRLFQAPTREACVAWWTIEKSNEPVVQKPADGTTYISDGKSWQKLSATQLPSPWGGQV